LHSEVVVGVDGDCFLPQCPFDRMPGAVDVAFDDAAVPGQGQPGGDRVLVTARAHDERSQGW
jgi:hypothetical protein